MSAFALTIFELKLIFSVFILVVIFGALMYIIVQREVGSNKK